MTAPVMTTTEGAPSFGDATVKATFDRMALHAFRAENVYRAVASVKPSRVAVPGNPVTFILIDALAPQTAELSETADPTHLSVKPSEKSVTLKEHGATAKHTKKLRLTSFIDLDLETPREVAANMEESLDIIARDVLAAGTRVLYVGGGPARVNVAATHTMTANHIRRARAELARKKTPAPSNSPFYVGFLHPDVSHDLQIESGQQAWSAPQIYREGQAGIWTGELGALGGVILVENANAPLIPDSGVTTTDVYLSIFVGLQALGEAVGEPQHMVVSGPFDDLQRFYSIGWYGLLGYGRVREDSIFRIESASSIGAN